MQLNIKKFGYTLAEMALVILLLGVIATMTIPVLKTTDNNKALVEGFKKFDSSIQIAVKKWKMNYGCMSAYQCTMRQNFQDQNCDNFDQIAKSFQIAEKAPIGDKSKPYWLPAQTLDYYGNAETPDGNNGVSQTSVGLCRYLLIDGTTFSVNPNPTGFWIFFDVNGIKRPNRIGKDTFELSIGYPASAKKNNDINYFAREPFHGVCGLGVDGDMMCNANNLDPSKDNGASPTTYVILNKSIPDFKELSQTISGIKP